MRNIENEIGITRTIFDWCIYHDVPVIHVANEGKRTRGYGAMLKSIGLAPGFPDLIIWEMRQGYGALILEIKTDDKSRIDPKQLAWIKKLNKKGYKALVTIGVDASIDAIKEYLSIPSK